MIQPIRARKIFAAAAAAGIDPQVSIPMPFPVDMEKGDASTRILESYILIALARIIKAKRIFEIGTFTGRTTTRLAENLDADIWTLDLPPGAGVIDGFNYTDLKIGKPMEWGRLCPEKRARITTLTGDSFGFDFSEYTASMDMVFVDGDHCLEAMRNDSHVAFGLCNLRSPACIVWHDYGNPEAPAVKHFLDGAWSGCSIQDTSLAVWFNPKAQELLW